MGVVARIEVRNEAKMAKQKMDDSEDMSEVMHPLPRTTIYSVVVSVSHH